MTDNHEARGRTGSSPMSLQRFEAILDAYGADASRWPAQEREAAEALIAQSAAARGKLAEAARLDELLNAIPGQTPAAGLAGRILRDRLAQDGATNHGVLMLLWPFGPLWQPAGVMAAAVLLGMLMGSLYPLPLASQSEAMLTEEEVMTLAYGNLELDEEWP